MARVDFDVLRQRARYRRQVLVEAGATTFEIRPSELWGVITCLCCGMRSRNQHDVEKRYCSFCKAYHDD